MPAMLAKPRQNRGKRIYCALLLVCCSLWVCSATGEEGNGKPFTASAFGSKSPSSASNNNNGAAPSTLNTKNNHHSFALVGRMMPFLQTLLITPKEARYIWSILSDAISAGDLVALSILGWGTVPVRFHLICDAQWKVSRNLSVI